MAFMVHIQNRENIFGAFPWLIASWSSSVIWEYESSREVKALDTFAGAYGWSLPYKICPTPAKAVRLGKVEWPEESAVSK